MAKTILNFANSEVKFVNDRNSRIKMINLKIKYFVIIMIYNFYRGHRVPKEEAESFRSGV